MLIIWGTKVNPRPRGSVAVQCPRCMKVRRFAITDHYEFSHNYYLERFSGLAASAAICIGVPAYAQLRRSGSGVGPRFYVYLNNTARDRWMRHSLIPRARRAGVDLTALAAVMTAIARLGEDQAALETRRLERHAAALGKQGAEGATASSPH